MEGIVNPTYSVPLTAASLDSRSSAWSESMSSSGTRPNGSEGSSSGMPFTNPFKSGSQSPDAARAAGGGHPFPATLPRRPSHLRTMATPSEEGGNPFDMLPPPSMGVSGGQRPPNDDTTFSNPFASTGKSKALSSRSPHLSLNLNGLDPQAQSPLSTPKGPGALAPAEPQASAAGASVTAAPAAMSGAPPIRPQEKAWIAPESWGVEGDLPDEEHGSSGEDAEGPSLELLDTLNQGGLRNMRLPGTPGIEADEFSWTSPGTDSASMTSRPLTGGSIAGRSLRQSTVSMGRSSTAGGGNRPGTGGWSKVGSASAASSMPVSCDWSAKLCELACLMIPVSSSGLPARLSLGRFAYDHRLCAQFNDVRHHFHSLGQESPAEGRLPAVHPRTQDWYVAVTFSTSLG